MLLDLRLKLFCAWWLIIFNLRDPNDNVMHLEGSCNYFVLNAEKTCRILSDSLQNQLTDVTIEKREVVPD